ncbi:MAG TPA: hypothetical protein VND91_11280 [Candidatus Saccharimonadia bacterium]|nr:hypothetical protein [Candidatus Saccharimonadia bacterium]
MKTLMRGAAITLLFAGACGAQAPVQDTVLDPTFGGDGRAVAEFDVGGIRGDVILEARTDGRGGYWTVGRAFVTSTRSILAIAHFDRAGNLLGKATRPEFEYRSDDSGRIYELQDTTVDADGLLLLSIINCTGPAISQCGSFLVRVTADASPDVRWGGTGTVVSAAGVFYGGVHAANDGRVWASRGDRLDFYSATGTFVGFAGGRATTFARVNDTTVLGLTGSGSTAAVLRRFDASGTQDLTYGGDGTRELGSGSTPQQCNAAGSDFVPRELSVLADGRIAVLGYVQDASTAVLQSYLVGVGASGASGPVACLAVLPADGARASGMALRSDGRVFVTLDTAPTGSSQFAAGMALSAMRLQPDGSIVPDPGFNSGQTFAIEVPRTDGGVPRAFATQVLVDEGAVVVFGGGEVANTSNDFTVARLLGDLRLFHNGFED